jgi:hypothetical protein
LKRVGDNSDEDSGTSHESTSLSHRDVGSLLSKVTSRLLNLAPPTVKKEAQCLIELFRLAVFVVFVFIFVSKTGSCYIDQAGLELLIFLPQLPKCWDYRCLPPHPDILQVLKTSENEIRVLGPRQTPGAPHNQVQPLTPITK